jgi:hypothetical protein
MFEYCSIWPTPYLRLRELARFPEPPMKSEVKPFAQENLTTMPLWRKNTPLCMFILVGATGKILKREDGRLAEHYLPEVVPGY